ncbi:MAG: hypothetical protein CL468_00995 [Acidimicrobiaceae bacterium]|nr:hypothetical protein [Acidimicrobiaceae bacterium]
MATSLDRTDPSAGYWPSAWPVECGGNRRQKARTGRLDASLGTAEVVTRHNDRWNVMVVERDPGEWFLGGTMPAFTGPPPYGWVERIDPKTLEPTRSSERLPCGDHVWCGAILAHANGSIHSINGSYLHRLDPDCQVVAERELPTDRSHNGLLALSDGTLVTKDLRLEGQGGTTITRLDPDDLGLVADPITLPEGSMGRIAADHDSDGDTVYVPGTEHLWRIRVDDDGMRVDESWSPRYRMANGDHGLAWDSCLSDGAAWLMDCGDIEPVRLIHTAEPNGRWPDHPGRQLSWRNPTPWSGAQRLLRAALDDPERLDVVEPFGTPGGGIIAPPVHVPEHQVAVAWDSVNGGLAGVDTSDGLDVCWHLDVRPTMQPVVFPDSAEMVINDFTRDGTDDLVVVDVRTGDLLDRVDTGSRVANGMFLTAGGNRDIFYCTTLCVARVIWQ